VVGIAIWGKNGLLEKVFLFPKVATKFKDLHVCLRVLCCASVVLQLADRKSSSFGSGGARLLVELLVSWIGWRVISLDWVCVFGQVGKRVCFGSLALFGFL
jgi:hypothetical protein